MYIVNTAYWDVHVHVHKYMYKYRICTESDTHYPDNVIASFSNDKVTTALLCLSLRQYLILKYFCTESYFLFRGLCFAFHNVVPMSF